MKYIDAEKLIAEIERQIKELYIDEMDESVREALTNLLSFITSLQQEQPELYFYCKYGGTMPLCSDCKRNHNNSPFKTEEIATWYAPSNGTKHCIDYIQQEQPKVDLEKEIEKQIRNIFYDLDGIAIMGTSKYASVEDMEYIARYFYELGLNAKREE